MNNTTMEFLLGSSNLTMSGNMTFVTEILPWWDRSFWLGFGGKSYIMMRWSTLIALVVIFGIIGFLIYKFAKGRVSE